MPRVQDRAGKFFADVAAHAPQKFLREFCLLIDGDAEAQAEFGVVFEERIGPCRAAAVGVLAPWSGRQVAAVDGGASGRIRDDSAISEELRDQLQIRRLAATGAGAGELEQRLLHLLLADGADLDLAAIEFRKLQEEFPVLAFPVRAMGAAAPC